MQTFGRIAGAVLLCLAAEQAAWPQAASAQSPAEFYKGKTLSLIIPNAPGGSFDLYARLVTTHLGRFIPGQPSFIAQNMACRLHRPA